MITSFEKQIRFYREAVAAGLEVSLSRLRGFYNTLWCGGDYTVIARATTMKLETDDLGKTDKQVYPSGCGLTNKQAELLKQMIKRGDLNE